MIVFDIRLHMIDIPSNKQKIQWSVFVKWKSVKNEEKNDMYYVSCIVFSDQLSRIGTNGRY